MRGARMLEDRPFKDPECDYHDHGEEEVCYDKMFLMF